LLHLKKKNSRYFQDFNGNSANSRPFQGFPGLWKKVVEEREEKINRNN